jgi:hypothetical protein
MRRTLALLTPARAYALALALVLAGCSAREHANPLDPANTETAGHPAGFTAIALSNQVVLTWSPTRGLATQLFRSSSLDPDFVAMGDALDPSRTSFADASALNGITYHYRLFFVTGKGLSGPPAATDATPSRVVAWTTDADAQALVRLGADAREIAAVDPGFGEGTSLALDRTRDLIWITRFFEGDVLIVNESTVQPVRVSGYDGPTGVAIDPLDGSGWVTANHDGTNGLGLVRHVLPSGQPGTPPSIAGVLGPAGIDLDPHARGRAAVTDEVLWICERDGDRVSQYTTGGNLLGTLPLKAPSRVAIDTLNGEAWITSFTTGQLLHVAADRSVLHTISGLQPLGVVVDAERGRIWVTDGIAGRVIAYRRDGTEEFRVNGLPGARDVAVESLSGEGWVTTRTTVARISATGTLLATTRGLSAPVGIGLDFVLP